jgi:hypothetical protein
MRKLSRFISAAAMVTLGLAAVPSVASADSPETTEPSQESKEDSGFGGEKLIDKALAEVQLRPEQKTEVETLKAEAEKRHAPVKAAKDEFALRLAGQIEDGKIARCGLAPQITALAAATAKAHPGDRAAFEQLHSILDPDQRAAFVDALKRQWSRMRRITNRPRWPRRWPRS